MVPLHLSAKNGHQNSTDILIENGALFDITDYADQTPLQYAKRGRTLLIAYEKQNFMHV